MNSSEHRELSLRKPPLAGPAKALVLLWFVGSFYQYPGIPIGQSSALQPAHVMFPLVLPALLLGHIGLRKSVYPMLIANSAFIVSFLVHLGSGGFDTAVGLRGLVSFNSYFIQILGGMLVATCSPFQISLALLFAVAGHFVVGCIQYVSFMDNQFPLLVLYNHTAYGDSWHNMHETYASYIQRPFGLFPEPSAMAASLGPWVAYLFSICAVRTHLNRSHTTRVLSWVGFLLGTALIVLSRSGHILVLGLSLLMLLMWNRRSVNKRILFTSAVICAGLLSYGAVWSLLSSELSNKFFGETNSWGDRWNSVAYAIQKYRSLGLIGLLTGIGPFNTSLQAQVDEGITGVASIGTSLFLETGLLGALAGISVLFLTVRAIRRGKYRSMPMLILIQWLGATLLTTSYFALPPVWTVLGFLMAWDTYSTGVVDEAPQRHAARPAGFHVPMHTTEQGRPALAEP